MTTRSQDRFNLFNVGSWKVLEMKLVAEVLVISYSQGLLNLFELEK